ncbi:MAG TPA: glycosyltransferase [Micromonosporaceae bacterium]|nr:glycosyltransferase [Micromonosporaceae bacterium]
MPWHRHTGKPRAHWGVLALGASALFATLAIDGFVQEPGSGTVQPGGTEISAHASMVTGPVVRVSGNEVTAGKLPAQTVALTFDDGPDPVWTPRILDALRRHDAKATFFVVGSRVNQHPELVRRIAAEGHELGLHSFTHRDLLGLPPWQRRLEFELARSAVARATGQDVRLFRPPYLASPSRVDSRGLDLLKDAGRSGYLTILADKDTKDWRRPGVPAIVSAATPDRHAGTIVLMHDGGGDRAQTVAALDTLLPALAQRGLHSATISAILPDAAPATRAATGTVLRGHALGIVQGGARLVARGLFVLLLIATALAVVRMGIQGYCAWRHARRRRRNPPPEYEPRLSVIVPAHNEAANIVATVESLLATGYPELEVIVVDDGSTDGTGDLVQAMNARDVRVVRQYKAGKAAALRAGIAAARHDVLVMIDGDTIVESDALALLARPFRDPTVGGVAGNAKVANRGGVIGRWQHLEYVVAFNLDRRVYETAECMPTVPGALGAFRRDALTAAGGVRGDTLAEDTDVTMAVCRAGWRVVYEDKACAWTEAPGTWAGLWRQRCRWSYGTMQAMWKHRAAVLEGGLAGKLGRRGLPYIAFFQILQPLLAPIVDVYLLYSLLLQTPSFAALLWLGLHVAQLAVAAYAFRLDREPAGPLWVIVLQQIGYRQLIYLVTIQSAVTALLGARLRWHTVTRTGRAAALAASQAVPNSAAAQTRFLVQQLRHGLYRDPLWSRLCIRLGVLLVVCSATVGVGGKVMMDRYQNSLRQADLLGPSATYYGQAGAPSADRPLNVLLVGLDWRKGQTGTIRSDTVMILHIPRNRSQAYLFSLPRDTIVDIPASDSAGFRGGRDRLNSSFAYGAGMEQDRARGGRLLAATVKRLTGLPGFDAAALIDFYGFSEVITAMGGIDVCVEAEVRSIHTGAVYPQGCGRMDGAAALDYLRQRKSISGSDYGRQRHQQEFIKSIAKEAGTQDIAGNPAKLDRMFRAAGGAVTVTTGPISPTEFLFSLRQVSPKRITTIQTPGRGVRDATNQYLGEELEPAAHELFRAVREERLEEFVSAHPGMASREF